MKKNCMRLPSCLYGSHALTKILRVMKLTAFLLTVALLQVYAGANSQSITYAGNNIPLKQVFSIIEKQTGYVVFSNKSDLFLGKPVSFSVKDTPLKDFLDMILKDQPLNYIIEDKTISLSRKPTYYLKLEEPAQEKKEFRVSGSVKSVTGEVLPGTSVRIKGLTQGAFTTSQGVYSIDHITENTVLQFTMVGYASVEVGFHKNGNNVSAYTLNKAQADLLEQVPLPGIGGIFVGIKLERSASRLDEVQVKAYGNTSQRYSTGSITTITAEEIARNPVPNVLEALQGKVPGMFIQQYSGRPNSAFSVEVRGRNSISNGNSGRGTSPLFIVDGVAYPFDNLPILNPGSLPNILAGGNGLDFLDPAQIESVNVLKDADATAIYGSRGAYGVVVITTKKGKPGVPSLNLNTRFGFSKRGITPKMLGTEDYLMLRKEAFANDNATPKPTDLDVNGAWPADRYTNWYNELAGNTAFRTQNNISYSGGTELFSYRLGGNYNVQNDIQTAKGTVNNGGVNFNVNTHSKNNKLNVSLTGSYSANKNDMVPYDFSTANSSSYLAQAPNAPALYNADGTLNWETGDNAAKVFNTIYKSNTNNLLSNLDIRFTPVKGLNVNATLGYNVLSGKEISGQPSSYFNPKTVFTTNSTLNLFNIRTLTFDPNISYQRGLFRKSTVTATVGMTLQDKLQYYDRTTGSGFLSDDLLYNPSFADRDKITTNYNQFPGRYLGYFAILNYSWNDKYQVNFSGRRDGSTRFGPNNRYGNFGSIGAFWIMSEEPWFRNALPFISFAKLRASIGTAGGDNIGDYGYLSTYSNGGNYQGNVALIPTSLANPYLQWEVSKKQDLNLLLEFLDGRVSVDATYYKNITSNQLVPQFLSVVTGFAGLTVNSPAIIHNWGYEINLNTINIKTKDFSWNSNFNITLPKNKLVSYPNLDVITNLNYVVGKPVTGIKLFKYAGVNPETGVYNFYKNGEKGEWTLFSGGSLDPNKDRTEFIDLSPKYYGGFTNNFKYKRFALDVLFSFTNRMGKNFLGSQTSGAGGFNQNTSVEYLQRWQKKGDITDVPKMSQNAAITFFSQSNFTNSTGAYTRATYARLQNLNISYTLNPKWLNRAKIKSLQVFAQGQNLLTFSKFGQLDPENLGIGTAPLRTYVFGLNLNL